jgi:hypothetical protein
MIPDSIMEHLDHIRGTLYGGLVDANPEVRQKFRMGNVVRPGFSLRRQSIVC